MSALFAAGAGSAAQPGFERGYFDVTVRGKIVKRWTYVENNPKTGASETSTFSGGDSGRAVVDVSWTVSFEPVTG